MFAHGFRGRILFCLTVILSQLNLPMMVSAQCPFPPIPDPIFITEAPVLSDDFLSSIVNAASHYLEQRAIGFNGGFTVAIVYNGRTIFSSGYGFKTAVDPATPDPFSSVFRIGSISKVFTTAFAYLARDARFLNFDAILQDYLGEFGGTGKLDQTSLRSIFGHLSGLPREAPCLENDCEILTKDILPAFENISRVYFPFTRPAYSNLAFALLGHAVSQAVTGNPDLYESLMQQWVFDKLNMSSSGYNYTVDVLNRLANGTANYGDQFDRLGWANPCGGAYSTAGDLANFLKIVTSNPENQSFMKPDTLREWLNSPAFILPSAADGYGYGFELQYDQLGQVWRVGKSGGISNWSAQILFMSEYRFGIAVLASDLGLSAQGIAASIADITFPNVTQQCRNLPTPMVPSPDPTKFIGEYSGYSIEAGGVVNISIFVDSAVLQANVTVLWGGVITVHLSWVNGQEFTIHFPKTFQTTCLTFTEISWTNEFLTFADDCSYLYFNSMLVNCKFFRKYN